MEFFALLGGEREALLDKAVGLDVARVVMLLVREKRALHFGCQPILAVGPPFHAAFGLVPRKHGTARNMLAFDIVEPVLDLGQHVEPGGFKYQKGVLESEDQPAVCLIGRHR